MPACLLRIIHLSDAHPEALYLNNREIPYGPRGQPEGGLRQSSAHTIPADSASRITARGIDVRKRPPYLPRALTLRGAQRLE